ncbi:hypothetical protein Hanom_Chr00s141727g01819291 [Helianthus anomalus]
MNYLTYGRSDNASHTQIAGYINSTCCFLLKQLLILYIIILTVHADSLDNQGRERIISQPKRRLSDHGAPKIGLAPAEPPNYEPLMRLSEATPPVSGFTPPLLADIAPTQSGVGKLPTGLAQPPLSPHASSKTSFFDYSSV